MAHTECDDGPFCNGAAQCMPSSAAANAEGCVAAALPCLANMMCNEAAGASGQHDEDCDPNTFGNTDAAGDGEVAASCCNASTSGPNCGTDCDDTTTRRRSGQVEFRDSVDNDCDGTLDEETQDVPWYPDNNCNSAVDELPSCDVVQLVGTIGGTLTTTAMGGGSIALQVPPGALDATTPLDCRRGGPVSVGLWL